MTYDRPVGGRRCRAPTRSRQIVLYLIVLLQPFGVVICFPAWGQVAPFQLPLPFPPEKPPLPEKPLPPRPPEVLPTPPTPPLLKPERFPLIKVFVREIRVIGSTALTPDEIAKVTAPYVNRELTSEDFEALRLALTFAYVNKGYVTSGAIIPDQNVAGGVLIVQIIEGKLSGIEVEGNEWFVPSYYQDRIALGAGPPLNVGPLQERLQLLQTDTRIQRMNAELRPGTVRGESLLHVQVKEAHPLKGWLEYNNFQSPTVGAEQEFVTVADQNLTGHGDILSVQYGRSSGVNPNLNVRYSLPITARDTTVSAQYRKIDFTVQEEAFAALNIQNKAEITGVSIRQPLYRSLEQEFAVALTGEYETNKSFLLGQPFEFFPGATNGVFRISALRLAQEWVRRTPDDVISALSRFSLGIGVLGATTTSDQNQGDGRFFAWLGEAQWARQIQPWRVQLLARTTLQLSNDHLFPLEQFAVGGRYSVRGYREFTLVRDNGFLGSFEIRVPVFTSAAGEDVLHLAPFVDVGRSWNTTVDTPEAEMLSSVGIGMLWSIWPGSHFEVYWGHRLKSVPIPGNDAQDHGVSFQLVVEVF